jgi:uncharacterized membrane protein
MEAMEALFRWIHIVAGIIWIGLLYFFNFVNAPFAATMDAAAKQKVVPELMPRALFWFRWGALWTWVTGLLLLMLVFWHSGLMFDPDRGSVLGGIVMVLVTLFAAVLYDVIASSNAAKDLRVLGAIGFIVVVIIVYAYIAAGFSYRGYVIHTGAMLGTTMAFNVWMRIWPAQRRIITATKAGTPPDAADVARAGARSRHNTYMSVPLVWTMVNAHTVVPFAQSPLWLFVAILAGWGAVYLIYDKAAKVKGF